MTNRAAALEYFVFDAISSAAIPIKEYANFYNLECPKNSTRNHQRYSAYLEKSVLISCVFHRTQSYKNRSSLKLSNNITFDYFLSNKII